VSATALKSGIYRGWVRHRRYAVKPHDFRYNVFMMYLDLAELDQILTKRLTWSTKPFSLAQFRRSDFFGDAALPLDKAVREEVERQTGDYPTGPIRLLANLRYFGYIMNPIVCYYCFDEQENLKYVMAEVNNTPWDERIAYVLPCEPDDDLLRIRFNKAMHVSPFNPMDVEYDWRSTKPGDELRIHMQNWREQQMEFDATLVLEREEITATSLRSILWRYPLMTVKVVAGIYWEALRLFIKGVNVHDHPGGEQSQKKVVVTNSK